MYVPPYGDSILGNGMWLSRLEHLVANDKLNGHELYDRAVDIMKILNEVKSDNL